MKSTSPTISLGANTSKNLQTQLKDEQPEDKNLYFLYTCPILEDPVSLPSGGLEKTTRSSLSHVAQHRPTGSETTPPYAPRSSRFGSEPPSVEDDVDVWQSQACVPEMTTTSYTWQNLLRFQFTVPLS